MTYVWHPSIGIFIPQINWYITMLTKKRHSRKELCYNQMQYHCKMPHKTKDVWVERKVMNLLMYFLRILSKFLGANLPFTTNLCCPSRDPLVPSSARRKVMTCSGCLCILRIEREKINLTVRSQSRMITKYNWGKIRTRQLSSNADD